MKKRRFIAGFMALVMMLTNVGMGMTTSYADDYQVATPQDAEQEAEPVADEAVQEPEIEVNEEPQDGQEIEVTGEAVSPEEVQEATPSDSLPPEEVIVLEDGAVTIEAEPGVLPEGVTMTAVSVDPFSDENYETMGEALGEAIYANGWENILSYSAYDITLWDEDGNSVQPEGSVKVTFGDVDFAGAVDAAVYHISDNNTVQKVTSLDPEEQDASFEASHFSIYVVGTTGDVMALAGTEKIAVYATDGYERGEVNNDNLKKLLGIPYQQDDGYFPIGVISLDRQYLTGNSPFIRNEATLKAVLDAISDIDKRVLIGSGGSQNQGNTVSKHLDCVQTDINGTAGTHKTALFTWTGPEHYDSQHGQAIEGRYDYHLDLRFATAKIRYKGVYVYSDGTQGTTVDLGEEVFLVGEEIQEPNLMGFKIPKMWTIEGFYNNNNVTQKYEFNQEKLTEAGKTIYCRLTEKPELEITKEADKDSLIEDEVITYTVTVKNNGALTLYGVEITDQLTGAVIQAGDGYSVVDGKAVIDALGPKQTVTITVKYTVTSADVQGKEVTNTVNGTSKDIHERQVDGSASVTVENPQLIIKKELTNLSEATGKDGNFKAGDVAKFTITVINYGSKDLYDVKVEEKLAGAVFVEGPGYVTNANTATITKLASGDSILVYAQYTITQEDIDEERHLTNIATVNDEKTNEVEILTEEKNIGLTAEKIITNKGKGENGSFKAGDTVEFNITVKNTGNTTLTDVTVKELLNGATITEGTSYEIKDGHALIGKLLPGNTVTVKATYTVTQDDIESSDLLKNVAVVSSGEEEENPEVEIPKEQQSAKLEVVKTADKTAGVKLGEEITYTITVTNKGNVTVSDIMVTDPLTGLEKNVGTLAPGERATVTTKYTVTEADIAKGSVENIATATDKDKKVTESSTVTVDTEAQIPQLTVTKRVIGRNYGYKLGDKVRYHVYVNNSGNVTVTDITVTDDKTGNTWVVDRLAPGESKDWITDEYTVTEEDILKGSVKNTAVAAGTANNEEVKDEDSIDVTTVKPNGHLTITKTTTSTPENGVAYELGEKITYSVTVTNDGNLTITNISVNDTLTGNTWTIESLAPGASETFTAEHDVTEKDILEGSVLNEATATGESPDPDKPDVPVEPGTVEDKTVKANPSLEVTKTADKTEGVDLNDVVTYTITVKNTGNVTIKDIKVSDRLTGNTGDNEVSVGDLGPGESKSVEVTYTVTERNIVTGAFTNYASATGSDPNGKSVYAEDDERVTTAAQNPKLTVTKRVRKSNYGYKLGDKVTYGIVVKNEGNVTLTNVVVTDELTGDTIPVESLAPGKEVSLTTKEYTVTEADIKAGEIVNTAAAEGTAPNGETVREEDSVTVMPVKPESHLVITKKATSTPENGTAYALGETVTYKITVMNDGNQTVTDITVTDSLTEENWTIESLAPGESSEFVTSYVVEEKDIKAGKVVNEATAKEGTDIPVDPGEETVPTETPNPSLFVTKTADVTKDAKLGDVITYTITVTNNGNVTITDVNVSDAQTGLNESIGELGPNVSETFTTTHEITEEDIRAGYYSNIATATGTTPNGNEVNGSDTEKIYTEKVNPSIEVTKRVRRTNAGYDLGDKITYSVYVENTGNVTLTDVVVTDPLTGNNWTIEELEPGQKKDYHPEYTVTEKDILAGRVVNIATARGTYEADKTVSDIAEQTSYTAKKNGHVTITKTTTSTPANGETYVLGERITYNISVKNDGNLTLKDVKVTDTLTKAEWTINTLEPGEVRELSTSYVVKEADIRRGTVKNVATATGTSPDPNKPEVPVVPGNTEDPTEPQNGHVTITKTTTSSPANGETYALGEKVTYSITATNDGNLTLMNVVVTDELTGDKWTIASFEPGAIETFTAEHVVTEEDILAGKVVNEATATGISPDPNKPEVPVEPGNTEDPTEPKNGHVTITKETTSEPENGTAYVLGEKITYSITATNDGNLTVTDITITDELTGDEWTIASLAPDASKTFTAEHVVTEADVLAGKVVNVATATGTSPDPDEPEVPVEPGTKEDPTEPKNGHVTITKTTTSSPANGATYALGETITYSIIAKNDGNLTLTGITVTDELTGDTWTIASLEPGDSETFTAEHVVTQADILAGSVVNVATAKGTSPDPEEPEVPVDPGETEVPTEPKNGHVTVTKTTTSSPANGTAYVLGETITYSITAMNDGNLTLTNVVVTDELTGDTWTIVSLEPGDSETFTAEYVITEADVLAGSVVNVATATGTSPDPDEPEVPVEPGVKEDPVAPENPENPENPGNPENPENPENPSNPENPGNPSNPSNPGSTSNPTDSTTGPGATTEIPDDEVPLAAIPDAGVPLSSNPDDTLIMIEDEDVPLSAVPQTGDTGAARALMQLFAAVGIMGLAILKRSSLKEEEQ